MKGARPTRDWRTDVFARAVEAGVLDAASEDAWRGEGSWLERQERLTRAVDEVAFEVVGRRILPRSLPAVVDWVRKRAIWQANGQPDVARLDFRIRWSDQ